MLLLDNYFRIDSYEKAGQAATFSVSLVGDCDVYRGHFPGDPVSPGVCNIEMVRECFSLACGSSPRIRHIDRCRFTAVASPAACPKLTVSMSWAAEDGAYRLTATVSDGRQQYMDFKGTLA